MSTFPLAVLSPQSTNIDPTDLRLISEPSEGWHPPRPWADIECDPDRRAWIESLVARNLLPKATSAVTCAQFFRKILEYRNHYVRVGKTTCHLATCRNCGTGKMRAHRLWSANPQRFSYITSECTRTMRLTIRYSAPANTLAEYAIRVQSDRRYLVSLWRRLRRTFPDCGFIRSTELDPARKDVTFRIYYVGSDPHHQWIRAEWQRIVGTQAYSESRSTWDNGTDALRWSLDSLSSVLMLAGQVRAEWEQAFTGIRLGSCVGVLRGVKLDVAAAIATGDDPEAPHGRCPCGCNGVIVKSDHHAPMTLTQLATEYTQVDFGPLRDYTPYRNKVVREWPTEYRIPPAIATVAPSPPS